MASVIDAVTFDCADPGRLAEFWTAAVGYVIDRTFGDDAVIAADPAGRGFRLAFMKVPEGKSSKNRVHLDLRAGDGMAVEVERLVGLGARSVEAHRESDLTWTVMQDPEGNEFCVWELPFTSFKQP